MQRINLCCSGVHGIQPDIQVYIVTVEQLGSKPNTDIVRIHVEELSSRTNLL